MSDQQQEDVIVLNESTQLSGLQLETAVRIEVGLAVGWELHELQSLFTRLGMLGLFVILTPTGQGWLAEVGRTEDCPATTNTEVHLVRESSNMSPAVAIARAVLAAVRTWDLAALPPSKGESVHL